MLYTSVDKLTVSNQVYKFMCNLYPNLEKVDIEVIPTDLTEDNVFGWCLENNNQFEMLKKLELSEEDHLDLIDYCNQKEINFLSTPFDEESALYLKDKVPFYKIPSGELTNLPYLKFLASLHLWLDFDSLSYFWHLQLQYFAK